VNSRGGPWWDGLFGYGTHLGDGAVLTLLLLLGLRLFDRNRFPKNFVLVGLALALAGGVNQVVKHAVDRDRPLADKVFQVEAEPLQARDLPLGLTVREYALQGETPAQAPGRLKVLGRGYRKNSFASGHTAAAFAFAAGLIYIFRRKSRWLLLIPAGFVGVSRIACGVHFPLDVLCGGVLGVAVSMGFLRSLEIFHGLGSPPEAIPLSPRSGAPTKVMMVVGEASADVYGSRILEDLKAREPDLVAFGVGGDRLKKAGMRVEADAHDLSIVGFTAVLFCLGTIVRVYRRLVRLLREESPDVLVCIDLPDFNLMLAAQARTRSIPVVFFISPQFWAWRRNRIRKIAGRISRMIVAFPFEESFYRDAGVPVSFHGHPILEVFEKRFDATAEAKAHFGLDPDKKTLVLAPGSRKNEFKYLLKEMFEAGARIVSELPGWQIAVPLAPGASQEEMRAAAKNAGIEPVFTRDDNFDLFGCADFGIVCSGTATLEASLAGLPMVIVYRGHRLNILLGRLLVKIDRIGLPNIILGGDQVAFPELIQKEAEAGPLARRVLSILRDQTECDKLRVACREVAEKLRGGDTSRAVAGEILGLAQRK